MHSISLKKSKEINLINKQNLSTSSEKIADLPSLLFEKSIANPSKTLPPQDLLKKITPPILFSSDDLKNLSTLLGYSSDSDIECGLDRKAIEALLSEDIDSFISRLETIKQIVILAEEKGHPLEDLVDDLSEKTTNDFIEALKANISPSFYLELLAFFDGIELYQAAYAHKHLFEKQKEPILVSAHLEHIKEVSSLTMSSALESKGGLTEITRFIGLYSKKELSSYFNSLQKILEIEQENTLAFKLSAMGTGLSLGYISSKNTWFVIHPKTLITQEINDSSALAEAVFSSLNLENERIIPISTEIYSAKNSEVAFQKLINTWKNTDTYRKIHETTKRKQQLVFSDFKMSWLSIAADFGDEKTVDLLLKAGANVKHLDSEGRSPLRLASRNGHTATVRSLIEAGADVNQPDSSGYTPLMIASQKGHADVVNLLLQANADVNQSDSTGWTPLMLASNYEHLEIVQLLYKHGAIRRLSHGDISDISEALGYKKSKGHCHGIAFKGLEAFLIRDQDAYKTRLQKVNKLAQKLEESGKLLSTLAKVQKSPLWLEQFIQENSPELLVDLLAFLDGVQLHQMASSYPHFFEKSQRPQLLQLHTERLQEIAPLTDSLELESLGGLEKVYLFTGVYTKKKLTSYFKSFEEAAKLASLDSLIGFQLGRINHSISVGYDPKEKAYVFIDANSPIIEKTYSSDLIAERVFSSLDFRENNKAIAIATEIYCTKNKKADVQKTCDLWENRKAFQKIHKIKDSALNINLLWLNIAAQSGDIKKIKSLLQTSIKANKFNYKYVHPLDYATTFGHSKVVNALLQAGANVNYKDSNGKTPLMQASYDGLTDIVKLFLASQADIDAVDLEEETAATIASSNGQLETLKVLLNAKLSRIFAFALKRNLPYLAG